MVIGTLCETYDESLYYQLCSIVQEDNLGGYESIENMRKDNFTDNLKFDVNHGNISANQATYFWLMMQRISQRAHMETKNWLDKVLLKLKRFAHKLERANVPKDGQTASIFQKLKAKVGEVIRKLTNLAMKAIGTNNRKGKFTTADTGIGYRTTRRSPLFGNTQKDVLYQQAAAYK